MEGNQGREGAAGIGGDVGRSSLQTGPGIAWPSDRADQVGGDACRDAGSSRDAACCVALSNKPCLDMYF